MMKLIREIVQVIGIYAIFYWLNEQTKRKI
jgi:hypothetical protein